MAPTETLHSHTVLSDGDMTHLEVLDTAQKYGVGIVAFTDHDILPSTEALQQLEKHRDHPVKWIVGVELTSKLPKELGDRPLNGLHIIGLFTDPTNEPLLAYCKAVRTSRLESIEKMVKNLQGLGFTLTVDDCRGFTKGQTLTRQHVAKALLSHAENMPVLDTYREQLRQAAASDKHLRGRYERMLDSEKNLGTREQDVYALFMGYNDAFVKGINVDYAHMADLDAVVSLIRGAGGLAILAHYHTILDKLPWDFLEKLFAENRLDGAEVVMGLHRSMCSTQSWRPAASTPITKKTSPSSRCLPSTPIVPSALPTHS